MRKFLLLVVAAILGICAANAEDYYLRGPLFYDGDDSDAWTNVDTDYTFETNTDNTLSIEFPNGLNTGNGTADSRNFAISTIDTSWPQSGTIVLGKHWKGNDNHTSSYSNGVPTNEALPVYFGGGRNGVLPANTTIYEIRLKLPTNTSDFANGNGSADYLPGSGDGWVMIITDKGVVTTGQSDYGLQTWKFSLNSTESAAWDISGGLMWPIATTNDPSFKAKYHKTIGTADYTVFRGVAQESLVQANEDGTPVTNYDPDKQIIQYHKGSKVYVIDYKHDLTNGKGGAYYPNGVAADGLYVMVPNAKAMEDDKSMASYYNVPKILRSGIRFGVYNHNATSDKYKYLKYGRAMRLNEKPTAIGFGSWDYWNGIPLDKVSDPTVTNMEKGEYKDEVETYLTFEIPSGYADQAITTTFYNAMGDNRLISEYNMFIERIILEVVNEGDYDSTDGTHEEFYIRFEGRYDLQAVTSDVVTFSYSDAGMENSTNKVGDEPNIYVGNTVRFFDRGFTRFYACYDPQYHDAKTYKGNSTQFQNDLAKFGLEDYTEGYTVKSNYSVLDSEGNVVNYIGYENKFGGNLDNDNGTPLDLAMKDYPATFSVNYKSVNDVDNHFMATAINGNDCSDYSGRYLIYSANPPEALINATETGTGTDTDNRYGNATEMIVQGRRLRLLYDQSVSENPNRPTQVKSETTYYFPGSEPNNVPTYTTTYDLKTINSLNASVHVNAVPKGYSEDNRFIADVNVTGSEYAYGSVWNLGAGLTKAYYPVTRWELSAKGTDMDASNNPIFGEQYLPSGANNFKAFDRSNHFKSEDFGSTLYHDVNKKGFGENKDQDRNFCYTAKMIYTFGNVYGTVDKTRATKSTVISENALRQYVDNNGENAYAIDYNTGTDGQKGNTKFKTFELTPKADTAFGTSYTPENLQVSLYQYPVKGDADVKFVSTNLQIPSGVEGVSVDASVAAEAEYYNLQGVRVITPIPGKVYIVRRGEVVTKELVR